MVFDQGEPLRDSVKQVKTGLGNSGRCKRHKVFGSTEFQLVEKDHFRPATMTKPRRIGYVRVSTQSQLTDRQVHQLEGCCDELRFEQVSAVAKERPVFDALLEDLQAGDTFVVLDLDRAFRSAIDAILTAQRLDEMGVHFEILTFPMNTATEEGAFVYGILALAAQLERGIIRRRTKEGLQAARRRGVRLGRPPRLSDATIRDAHTWIVETGLPCRYVAALLGVNRLTLQRSFHRLSLTYPIPPKLKGGIDA